MSSSSKFIVLLKFENKTKMLEYFKSNEVRKKTW